MEDSQKMEEERAYSWREETAQTLKEPVPVGANYGVIKLYRILVLICTFTGSAFLWWAFNVSTWVQVEIPGNSQVLFSALFAICSDEVTCWVPLSRSNCFIFGRIFMISALLLSFFLSFVLLAFPHFLPDIRKQYYVFTITFIIVGIFVILALLMHSLHTSKVHKTHKNAKVTFLYPCAILICSAILFILSGILCFLTSHHCCSWCASPQPVQVKPKQASVIKVNPNTQEEKEQMVRPASEMVTGWLQEEVHS